ncbi:MAG: hypothetical protein NC915_03935 [Candidatus Omnitrophica bacterium]|nr:hypothetical protein [Candidatus Omnitrophota bacterium]
MKNREKTPIWEDIVIILSIFSLWPSILRRETIITKILMFVFLGLLIWLLKRRITRIKNL